MTFPNPPGGGGCGAPPVQCGSSYLLCGCGVAVMSGCNYPEGYAGGPTTGDRDCVSPGSPGGPGGDGGVDAETSEEAGEAGTGDEAGEAGLPDGAGEETFSPGD